MTTPRRSRRSSPSAAIGASSRRRRGDLLRRDRRVGAEVVYGEALAEYRFQVQLNAQRTQFFLTFSAALLAAGTGLLSLDGSETRWLTGAVFVVGASTSVICAMAHHRQHEYYRRARDRLRAIEEVVAPGFPPMDTTAVMAGTSRRFRVTGLIAALLVLLAALHALGVLVVVASLVRGAP